MRHKVVKSQQLLHVVRKRQEKPLYVSIRVPLGERNGCMPQTTRPQPPPDGDSESKGNGKKSFPLYKRNTRSNKRRSMR